MLKCDSCGIIAQDVKNVVDPYIEEIEQRIVRKNMCKKCIQSAKDDI